MFLLLDCVFPKLDNTDKVYAFCKRKGNKKESRKSAKESVSESRALGAKK